MSSRPHTRWARRGFAALALSLLGSLAAQASTLQARVLDREGQPVADAVLEVLLPPSSEQRPSWAASALVTQEKMQFIPRVSVVVAGMRLRFTNQDRWDHHVRVLPASLSRLNEAGGMEFRLSGLVEGQPASSQERSFDQPGVYLLGCHLHSSMRGHVYVAESPWVAKTGADGTVSLQGLPTGVATVRLWQADEVQTIAPRTVTLGASPQTLDYQLSVVPRRRR